MAISPSERKVVPPLGLTRSSFPIHKLFERSCELGLWRLTANKIAAIFGSRLHRRHRGKLATVIDQIEHGHHVFRAYFKSDFLKPHVEVDAINANDINGIMAAAWALAPPSYHGASRYSITSSAAANNVSGMVRPRALAVLRLMMKWNFEDLLTGRSAGMAPLRIWPTNAAAIRVWSAMSVV